MVSFTTASRARNHQPSGFVDDPVEGGDWLELLVHFVRGAYGCVCRMSRNPARAPSVAGVSDARADRRGELAGLRLDHPGLETD